MLGLQLLRLLSDAYVRHGGNVGSLTPRAEPSRQTSALRSRPAGSRGGYCHSCWKFKLEERKGKERCVLKHPSLFHSTHKKHPLGQVHHEQNYVVFFPDNVAATIVLHLWRFSPGWYTGSREAAQNHSLWWVRSNNILVWFGIYGYLL